jgi:hypothetical protein
MSPYSAAEYVKTQSCTAIPSCRYRRDFRLTTPDLPGVDGKPSFQFTVTGRPRVWASLNYGTKTKERRIAPCTCRE